MERVTPDPIEIGAHIDPEGHNLYRIPEDGIQYSIAPYDFNTSLERFRAAFDQKLYTVKQLEHARLLLVAYLAGKQGGIIWIAFLFLFFHSFFFTFQSSKRRLDYFCGQPAL